MTSEMSSPHVTPIVARRSMLRRIGSAGLQHQGQVGGTQSPVAIGGAGGSAGIPVGAGALVPAGSTGNVSNELVPVRMGKFSDARFVSAFLIPF